MTQTTCRNTHLTNCLFTSSHAASEMMTDESVNWLCLTAEGQTEGKEARDGRGQSEHQQEDTKTLSYWFQRQYVIWYGYYIWNYWTIYENGYFCIDIKAERLNPECAAVIGKAVKMSKSKKCKVLLQLRRLILFSVEECLSSYIISLMYFRC